MKLTLFSTLAACAAIGGLAATAGAQGYTTLTPGALIPAAGTGGGTYNNVGPSTSISPFTSTVAVPVGVTTVDGVTIEGWTHTWLGDMQIVLVSPDGIGHNLLVRLGHSAASTFGNSGDPTGTPHSFHVAGLPPPDTTVATNMPAGAYQEHYGNPAKLWTAGNTIDGTVVNNGLAGIGVQAAGNWELRIYDWAGGDTGALTAWRLEVNGFPPPAPTVYCTAKANSLNGSGTCPVGIPAIGTSGFSSASNTGDFNISAINIINNKIGILIYKNSVAGSAMGAQPFAGGTLCLASGLGPNRSTPVNSGGTPAPANDCTGIYTIDMNDFAAGVIPGPPLPQAYLLTQGQEVVAQFWGRDPGFAPPNNVALTDAVLFVVGP